MKNLLLAVCMLCCFVSVNAQKAEEVPNRADEVVQLWDNKTAPHSNEETEAEQVLGKKSYRHTSDAKLYIYKADPAKATGQAVVIYPGGSYIAVNILGAGFGLAEYCRSLGLTAVVLKYRLPNNGHKEATLEDAQEALRFVRKNAARLHVNPDKVGLCGSSAGGHLGAWVSNVSSQKEKPAFAVLFYPAITATGACSNAVRNCLFNLMGKDCTAKAMEEYSQELHVDETTPPTLLFHCDDDQTVPVKASAMYYEALKAHGIFASLHIFPSGGHAWAGSENFKYAPQCKEILADWFKLMNK